MVKTEHDHRDTVYTTNSSSKYCVYSFSQVFFFCFRLGFHRVSAESESDRRLVWSFRWNLRRSETIFLCLNTIFKILIRNYPEIDIIRHWIKCIMFVSSKQTNRLVSCRRLMWKLCAKRPVTAFKCEIASSSFEMNLQYQPPTTYFR